MKIAPEAPFTTPDAIAPGAFLFCLARLTCNFSDSPELPAFLGRDEWRVSERGRGNCSFPMEESSERVCERALRTEGS